MKPLDKKKENRRQTEENEKYNTFGKAKTVTVNVNQHSVNYQSGAAGCDGIAKSLSSTQRTSDLTPHRQREPQTHFEQGGHSIRFATKFTLKAGWRVDRVEGGRLREAKAEETAPGVGRESSVCDSFGLRSP